MWISRVHVYVHLCPKWIDSFHMSHNNHVRGVDARVWIRKNRGLCGTLSNVRKEERKKPHPPCAICRGSGRVDCHHCQGRGRTNCVHLAMLPKGEWPKWCRTCGGSGLGYCARCLGTGEYRDIMGFHFMKMDPMRTRDHKEIGNQGRHGAADLLPNEEHRTQIT
ncbi:hypothetical protein HHK36_028548 [Tetracentron sinense]|uniref:Uncharacterized protein n=1 Tax=Tetracentron sinense TaxID=13715 RepID=A0A834YGJ1_TETSI|nr:hypothetical protein HHK36_028548 [Tetracentron sinense]